MDNDSMVKIVCLCSNKTLYTNQLYTDHIWFVDYSLLSPVTENKTQP